MSKLFNMFTMVVLLILFGCTANTEDVFENSEFVEVEFLVPKDISLTAENTIKVRVTQGNERVEDAEDVHFEIWKIDGESKKKVSATHEKNGLYSMKMFFKEEGIYQIQVHVTARGMHVMPTEQVVIGNLSEDDIEKLEENSNIEEQHEHQNR